MVLNSSYVAPASLSENVQPALLSAVPSGRGTAYAAKWVVESLGSLKLSRAGTPSSAPSRSRLSLLEFGCLRTWADSSYSFR